MASEITETSKLYARCIARVDPLWLEEVGAHLIRRSYFDPHWEQKAMQVAAWERSTLYGIVVNHEEAGEFRPDEPGLRRARSSSARVWSAARSTRTSRGAGRSGSTTRS